MGYQINEIVIIGLLIFGVFTFIPALFLYSNEIDSSKKVELPSSLEYDGRSLKLKDEYVNSQEFKERQEKSSFTIHNGYGNYCECVGCMKFREKELKIKKSTAEIKNLNGFSLKDKQVANKAKNDKLKKELKVGQRVRLRGFDCNGINRDGEIGIVIMGSEPLAICIGIKILPENDDDVFLVAPSQCIPLKKKKREEYWVNISKNGPIGYIYPSKEYAGQAIHPDRIGCIKLVKAKDQS